MFSPDERNLIIVAHPDDEVLFAYSALSRNKNWHVLCMTNEFHPVRSKEFDTVINALGLTYEMWAYPDVWDGDFPESAVLERLKDIVPKYDNVLTHNAFGEYGHKQHRSLHYIVNKAVKNNLYTFGHIGTPLDFNTLAKKLDILKLYKSQYDLNAFDWHDQDNKNNNLMKYVVSEGFCKVQRGDL